MIKNTIKRCLLIFMTCVSFNLIGSSNYNNVYASRLQCNEPIYNLEITSGEKLIKASKEKDAYNLNINNNVGRVMIKYECSSVLKSEDLEIIVDKNKEEFNNLKYNIDFKNSLIIIENLQEGINVATIKYKPDNKSIYKIYINYSKNAYNNKTGWVSDLGKWYYIDSYTHNKKIGWLLDEGNWYYLSSNGVMQNGWVLDGHDWYYFDSRGIMQSGWIKDSEGKCYYLNPDGSLGTIKK